MLETQSLQSYNGVIQNLGLLSSLISRPLLQKPNPHFIAGLRVNAKKKLWQKREFLWQIKIPSSMRSKIEFQKNISFLIIFLLVPIHKPYFYYINVTVHH
jgi:hypothetical protein